MAMFPSDMQNGAVGGALIEGPGYVSTDKGCLVYLNGGDTLDIPLAKVEAAGGKILMPKTSIGGNGYYAIFQDSEGNKVAFHSMN